MGIAVITGAAHGIGRALARQAAARGLSVALADRDRPALRAVAEELGEAVRIAMPLDLADSDAVGQFAREVQGRGHTSLLLANAGILRMGSMLEARGADWNDLIDVNVKGTLNTLVAFASAMVAADHPSRIVITGSEACFDASPGVAVYSATKHAVWALADGLRNDLAAAGVRHVGVSLAIPGIVATSIAEGAGDKAMQEMRSMLRAIGSDPDEMAEVIFAGIDAGSPYIFLRPDAANRLVERAQGLAANRVVAPNMPQIADLRWPRRD